MECISFNGKTLFALFIEKLDIDKQASVQEQRRLIGSKVTKDHLCQIMEEQLLGFCSSQEKERYARQLSTVFYQWGIIYTCAQSLSGNSNVGDKGFLITGSGLANKVNIYTKGNNIYVEEKIDLMTLVKSDDISERLVQPDGTPLATFRNRFHIKVLDSGNLGYKHTDLTIHYRHDKVRSLYDTRGFIDKVKDFLKSVFRMNDIQEYSMPEEGAASSLRL